MKRNIILISLIFMIAFSFIACNGENAYRQEEALCMVGNKYFISVQDAIKYLSASSKDISQDRTIKLIRDVTSEDVPSYQRSSIQIPAGFTGDVKIDLSGHTYEFASDEFFSVLSDINLVIANGQAVINSTSNASQGAFEVKKGNLTISDVVVTDNRNKPKAASISSQASITVEASSSAKTLIKGLFEFSGNAKLTINSGSVAFTGISEPEDATDNILIYGGDIRNIHDLNNRITEAVDAVPEEDRSEIKRDFVHGPVEAHAAKAATCTENGNTAYYICKDASCGKFFSDSDCLHEIDSSSTVLTKTGHKMQLIPAKDATCTEAGNYAYYQCTVCKNYFRDESGIEIITDLNSVVIDKLAHSIQYYPATESDCKNQGHDEYYQCNNCKLYFTDITGKTETSEPKFIDLLEHIMNSSWSFDNDNHWVKCTKCEEPITGTSAEHSFSEWSVTDTQGTYRHECSICGYWEEATECRFKDYEANPATCTENGNIAYSQCELHKDYYLPDHTTHIDNNSIIILATGHTSDESKWESNSEEHYHICSVCKKEYDVETHSIRYSSINSTSHSRECSKCGYKLASAEHNMSEWAITGNTPVAEKHCLDNCGYTVSTSGSDVTTLDAKDPTCTEAGNYAYKYSIASDGTKVYFSADESKIISIDETVIKATGHIAVSNHDETYHWGTCSVCGAEISKGYHQFPSNWNVEKGVATRECSSCGFKQTTNGATDIIEVPANDSTCTSKGNIKYFTCESILGKDMVFNSDKTEVIHISRTITAMLDHSLVKTDKVDASCSAPGHEEYWTCSVCNQIFADENASIKLTEVTVIPQLKHEWSTEYEKNESYHWQTCLNECGTKNLYSNHTFTDWKITEPKAKAVRQCTECGYNITATFVHIDATTAAKEGYYEHYKSAEHNLYMNAEGTALVRKKDITIPKLNQ